MPFLSRRHPEPQVRFFESDLELAAPKTHPTHTSRNRAVSDGVFSRVSTLFGARKRTRSKPPPLKPTPYRSPLGFIRSSPVILSRLSNDSTPPSSPEIRRPSGLGRRASDLEYIGQSDDDSGPTMNDFSKSFLRPAREPTNFDENLPLPLPGEIIATILYFLRRSDLAATALVSRGFCSVTRHILYCSIDFQTLTEPQLESLCATLAAHSRLAERVRTLFCHFWPRSKSVPSDNHVTSPSAEFIQALQNMRNLQVLTMQSFASILLYSPLLTFSLIELTILDESLTQAQSADFRTWLASQTRLRSLSFPNLVEFVASGVNSSVSSLEVSTSSASSISTREHEGPEEFLPSLKTLHAPTSIATSILSDTKHALQLVSLHVHDTLYTGLRPAVVLRTLKGANEMHVIFGHGVDKRTAEKFLGTAGSILIGECRDRKRLLECLHVEVLWSDDDAAERVYKMISSIISRFCGLRRLKLTTPHRTTRTLAPMLLSFPLPPGITSLPSPSPTVVSAVSQLSARNVSGGVFMKEFVACGGEKTYAKAWSKQCPTLSDIQFDFSTPTSEVDVELCGVWFRRKVPTS
ncbi:hypothetical protein V8B97DRAFT_1942147 [Scleroderma yunnanense]